MNLHRRAHRCLASCVLGAGSLPSQAQEYPRFRKYLTDTRHHVAAHLKQAVDLQAMR